MNRFIAVLVFLTSLPVWATQYDINQLVESLEIKYLQSEINSCQLEDEEEQLLQECMQDLCGKPDTNRSAFMTPEKFEMLKSDQIENQFQSDLPKLSTQIETQLTYAEKLIAKLEQKKDQLKFTEAEASELLFQITIPHLDIIYNQDNGELEINHDLAKTFNTKDQIFYSKFLDKIKKQALENWEVAFELGLPIQKKDLIFELTQLKKTINENHFEEKKKNQYISLISTLEQYLQNPWSIETDTPKMDYTIARIIQDLKNTLQQNLKIKPLRQFCDDLNCSDYFKEQMLDQFKANLNKLKYSTEILKEIGPSKIANECKSLYYLDQIESGQSGKEQELAQQYIEKSIKTVKALYSEKTSEHFSNYLQNVLQKSFDNKVPNGKTFSEDFNQRFTWETELKSKQLTNFDSISDYELTSQLYAHIKNGSPVLSDVFSTCRFGETDRMLLAGDFYNPMKNFLKISNFTCNHDVGAGSEIFLHELGHVFSELVARNTSSKESRDHYLSERSCVSSQYYYPLYSGNYRKWHPYDHFRSEEDTADYFAAKVSYFTDDQSNKQFINSCVFLQVRDNQYDNLFLEQTFYDSHSSSAMRVIREANYKDIELPLSCKDVMLRNEYQFKLKRCE